MRARAGEDGEWAGARPIEADGGVANKSASDGRVTALGYSGLPAATSFSEGEANRIERDRPAGETLIWSAHLVWCMEVAVTVAGEGSREVTLPAEATYDDLLDAVDRSRHEATVLVDGQPVPADAPVEADAVTVLQLVKGG